MQRTLEERLRILEDQHEIAQLQARYVDLNDGGWQGPTHCQPLAVANLFVDDGIWEGPPGCAQGREAIAELFRSFQAIPFIVHYVTNPLIVVDGDSAHGEWHAIVTSTTPPDRGASQALWTLGKYVNDYSRTPAGWRYTRLRFAAAAITPFELGWAKQQFLGPSI
ncbi:nuclear transport factor 2 family protein [Paraburkholderia phymatum]|uniref:nuclear transport factor 2 family protein n=1 Tax=Paraburkholderia phymatum TaxID=148447 RepID=UPI00316E27CC